MLQVYVSAAYEPEILRSHRATRIGNCRVRAPGLIGIDDRLLVCAATQDISSGGVYFFLLIGIPEGTTVEVEMAMPAQITLGAPTRVRCRGRIHRCELKAGDTAGMATAIEKYEFLPGTEDAA